MLTIKQAQFLTSAAKKDQWPIDNIPEFCFIGRSNVGKSSFLNSLVNQKQLARTSHRPGKTTLLNFFSINKDQLRFVDVPGYGFAKISQKEKQNFIYMIDEYLTHRQNLKAIYLLLDFRHKPSNDDLLIFKYLQAQNQQIILVATKVDKIVRGNYEKHKKVILKTLNLVLETPIILFSSVKKLGQSSIIESMSNIINEE